MSKVNKSEGSTSRVYFNNVADCIGLRLGFPGRVTTVDAVLASGTKRCYELDANLAVTPLKSMLALGPERCLAWHVRVVNEGETPRTTVALESVAPNHWEELRTPVLTLGSTSPTGIIELTRMPFDC